MKGIFTLSTFAVLAAFGLIYGTLGLTTIEPGEVGVLVKNFGDERGMQDETWDTGAHWADPFVYDAVVYDTRLRQYQLTGQNAIPANTLDGQPVVVDVSLEIGLVDAGVPNLHENVGTNWYDQIVLPLAISTIRNETSFADSDTIYTGEGRASIQQAVTDVLQLRLAELGIRIMPNLRDITFTNQQFVDVLEEKARAAQQEEIRRREALAAAQEAIRIQNVAEGQRFQVEQEADAERYKLQQEGEGARLRDEAIAAGNLALFTAEAEGQRLRREALSGDGGAELVSIEWARNLGPNVQFYGVPTGAEGTSTYLIDEALRGQIAIGN